MTTHLRRVGAITVAAVLAIGLTGCSKPKEEPPTTGKPSSSVSTGPSATSSPSPTVSAQPTPTTIVDPNTGETDFCKATKQAPSTGPASDLFGADNVTVAYCHFGNFGMTEGWTNLMESKPSYAPIEFSFVKPWMTTELQKGWDGIVAKAIAGDEQGTADVNALTGFNREGPKYQFDPNMPRVIKRSVSAATTSVGKDRSGAPALILTMTFKGDMVFNEIATGKKVALTLTRAVTFTVVPNGAPEHPWLIDAFTAKTTPDAKFRPLG